MLVIKCAACRRKLWRYRKLGPGEVCGETAAMTGDVRIASVQALDEVRVTEVIAVRALGLQVVHRHGEAPTSCRLERLSQDRPVLRVQESRVDR